MDVMKAIENLASLARDDTPPALDVIDDVMRHIQYQRTRPRIVPRDLGWIAMASAAAAAAALFVATQAWWALSDPLSVFFKPLFLVNL